jgi:hypothetical protein
MEKRQFIELTSRFLSGNTAPADVRRRYHPQIVEKYIEMAYDELIAGVYAADPDPNKATLDSYLKSYSDVAITEDTTRSEYYSLIPTSKLVQLPDNSAIRLISPMGEQGTPYIYRKNNSKRIFTDLEVNSYLNRTKFYVEGGRVWYNAIYGTETTVFMKLIVPFSEFDDNEQVPLPLGKDSPIFDKIISRLQELPPNDMTIDSNAKQV